MDKNQAQQTLESPIAPDLGRWKIKRNIHFWLIGFVAFFLAFFMILQAVRTNSPDNKRLEELRQKRQQEVANINRTDKAPSSEGLDKLFRDQQQQAGQQLADANTKKTPDAAGPSSGQATSTAPAENPGVPGSAQVPAALQMAQQQAQQPGLPPLPAATGRPAVGLPTPESMRNGAEGEAQASAKREEQIAASPIMAIDKGARVVSATPASASPGIASLAEQARQNILEREKTTNVMADRLSASAGAGGLGAGARPGANGGGASGSNELFIESMSNNRSSANDVIKPLATRGGHALMQGSIIPAVLITEIRSDLPGDIKAATTMDVYDSVNGSVLLIPKGTVLAGKYNSEVRVGQEKVMAGFTRLIFPSGASVDLGGMKGAEGSGESGLADDVDNHFFKMFGANFLIAGLAQVFQNNSKSTTVTNYGTTNVTNTAGEVLADTVKAINQRNTSIAPTVYVYRGHKFNVMVNKDMVLPPYMTGVKQ